MEISELKELKLQMEKSIRKSTAEAVREFENATGIYLESIDVELLRMIESGRSIDVSVRVNTTLNL